MTEPPVPITQEVPSVIVESYLLNSRHVEISLTGRIQGQKSQGEDVILTGSLIDKHVSDGGCG